MEGGRASISSRLVAPRALVAEGDTPGLQRPIHGGIRRNVGGIVLS